MERFSSKKCFYCPILTRYNSDNISLRGLPQFSIRLEQGIISYKTTDMLLTSFMIYRVPYSLHPNGVKIYIRNNNRRH